MTHVGGFEEVATTIAVLLLPVAAVLAILSTGYLWWVWRRARIPSSVYRDNVIVSSAIVLSGLVIAPVALVALLELPRLPLTGLVVTFAILVMLLVPAYLASRVLRIRRRASRLAREHREQHTTPPGGV